MTSAVGEESGVSRWWADGLSVFSSVLLGQVVEYACACACGCTILYSYHCVINRIRRSRHSFRVNLVKSCDELQGEEASNKSSKCSLDQNTLFSGKDDCPDSTLSAFLLVAFYVLFGVLHEAAHIAAAALLGLSDGILDDGEATFLVRIVFGRRCIIPSLAHATGTADEFYVRHFGWIASLFLSIGTSQLSRYFASRWEYCRNKKVEIILWHAAIASHLTAIEALSTDLLALDALPLLGSGRKRDLPPGTFLCGNFGIILINSAWMRDDAGRKAALRILEKMINVTMMRGAQSGGIVTFTSKSDKAYVDGGGSLYGLCARVVNSKRTDLSQLLIAKLNRVAFSRFTLSGGMSSFPSSYLVRTFCGHTRFATSSKATSDGTHPHRWTPARKVRMYNFYRMSNGLDDSTGTPDAGPSRGKNKTKLRSSAARLVNLENYITHNGDLDFFDVRGKTYDLGIVQEWLEVVTETPRPSDVDSAAIAGLIDLLRTQGSFALSARFAVCFGMSTSKMDPQAAYDNMPTYKQFESIGTVFEEALENMLKEGWTLEQMSAEANTRKVLCGNVLLALQNNFSNLIALLAGYIDEENCDANLLSFVQVTVNAFFDNDLLHATKLFMKDARGSFGICINSSFDAHRQVCLASRGQPMTVAFYPKKGIICYASELAAVKAVLGVPMPGGDLAAGPDNADGFRVDLDEMGGEICLLDYGSVDESKPVISMPNRNRFVEQYKVMMGIPVTIYTIKLSEAARHESRLSRRSTLLEENEFIKPLQDEPDDLVLSDIRDIPRICQNIQGDWNNSRSDTVNLNRLTALNLVQALKKRLQAIVDGSGDRRHGTVDILLTGCEVSLWLAEQFAGDLKKVFPRLGIKAISSNKLLGLYGQEMSIPALGYPYSKRSLDLTDSIVIIVSHSGGTFAPMQCSSLLQSKTRNIFAITSEWDTVISKQLRGMYKEGDMMLSSRIFTTEVGIRPAEPCSVSVVATHQLLTNLFQHICTVVISNPDFRRVTEAAITQNDLTILERCNQDNIAALEAIVGVDYNGQELMDANKGRTEKELRAVGDLWAEHILENAKAYIMTFVYVVVTVTVGYPLITGIAVAAGLHAEWAFYLTRFIDALIYFCIPQINTFLLRLVQGRNLRHRMVGRTVVIADVPWVAQAGEAFLSKIFACSYSIAGLNVLSGNPADHFVHRHTHRVCRGTLLVCGRPDGRLKALTSLEASICLSVNQASSIQSMGGTCESVTIGSNPYKLPLSKAAIFLERHRPLFLCEHLLDHVAFSESAHLKPRRVLGVSRHECINKGILVEASDPHMSEEGMFDSEETKQGSLALSCVDEETNHTQENSALSVGRSDKGSSKNGVDKPKVKASKGSKNGFTDRRCFARPLNIKSSSESPCGKSSVALMGAYSSMSKEAAKLPSNSDKLSQGGRKPLHRSQLQSLRESILGITGDMYASISIPRHSPFGEGQFDAAASRDDLESSRQNNVLPSRHHSHNSTLCSSQTSGGFRRRHMSRSYSERDSHMSAEITAFPSKPRLSVDDVIAKLIEEKTESSKLRNIFYQHDGGKNQLSLEEFICAYANVDPDTERDEVIRLFHESSSQRNGRLGLAVFLKLASRAHSKLRNDESLLFRDENGLVHVKASSEEFFGAKIGQTHSAALREGVSNNQDLAMELYESRINSLQRFVAMTVMFHQMGSRVQSFFPRITLGMLGYRMDRTHSIMRVATTASPVSGADVREQMEVLQLMTDIRRSIRVICHAWAQYKAKKDSELLASFKKEEDKVKNG